MSDMFDGKTVAITGAAGGIGRALSRFFATEGAALALTDRSPEVIAFACELQEEGFATHAAVADIGAATTIAQTSSFPVPFATRLGTNALPRTRVS